MGVRVHWVSEVLVILRKSHQAFREVVILTY